MKPDIFKLIWSHDGMKQIIAQIIEIIDNDHNLMKYEKKSLFCLCEKISIQAIFFLKVNGNLYFTQRWDFIISENFIHYFDCLKANMSDKIVWRNQLLSSYVRF